MANITVTITAIANNNTAISGATVKIYGEDGSQIASGTTDTTGAYAPVISSTDTFPAKWRFTVTKRGYAKAGGYVVFANGTTGSQNTYLQPDRRG